MNFIDYLSKVLPIILLLLINGIQCVAQQKRFQHNPGEAVGSHWRNLAQDALRANIKLKLNENVAKNIIFFLGDGMGITTITAARIFKGQQNDRSGEEGYLEFEKFPYVSLVKTYNVDTQVPDSAGTATAYLCGVKGNYETLGVDARTKHSDCNSSIGAEVSSILEWARDSGKETGFITTTRVTHASPAALYAHSAFRYWETDKKMPANASRCKDIARQLVEDLPGKDIKVILGGGRGYFTPEGVIDSQRQKEGLRGDGRNLIEEWKNEKKSRNASYKYLENKQAFDDWDPQKEDYILGLFDYNHMAYDSNRLASSSEQPSLAEMTRKALERLQKSPQGFFIFIEGGRIDHAHHDGLVRHSLEEAVAMDEAIKTAVEMTDEEDTLIIVTADHSHVLTINGYPKRGNSILGLADTSDIDNMTYTTLMYTNGPGFRNNGSTRYNLSNVDTTARNFTPQVAVPLIEDTHGGEDVAVYARGPMAHLFRGVQEQNYIPHALAYAACIGNNLEHCALDKSAATRTSYNSVSSESISGGSDGVSPRLLAFPIASAFVLLYTLRNSP